MTATGNVMISGNHSKSSNQARSHVFSQTWQCTRRTIRTILVLNGIPMPNGNGNSSLSGSIHGPTSGVNPGFQAALHPDEWPEAGRGLKHHWCMQAVSARGSSQIIIAAVRRQGGLRDHVFKPDEGVGRFVIISLGAAFHPGQAIGKRGGYGPHSHVKFPPRLTPGAVT